MTERGLPWLVAEYGDAIAGYGYCAPYRARSAYRYALEDSVYVRHDMQGRGVGRALLDELVQRCEAAGYRQIIAVIGDGAHAASINLHAAAGFLQFDQTRPRAVTGRSKYIITIDQWCGNICRVVGDAIVAP